MSGMIITIMGAVERLHGVWMRPQQRVEIPSEIIWPTGSGSMATTVGSRAEAPHLW